jgi:hypothetical protein
MSTSEPSRPEGSPPPTRQQLDELDALLQRMLELPVNKLADDAASEPAGPVREAAALPLPETTTPPVRLVVVEDHAAPAPPTPAARPELRLVPPPEPAAADEGAADWVPFRSAWRPSAQTWGPLAESWWQAQGERPRLAAPDSAAAAEGVTPAPEAAPPSAETTPAPPEAPPGPPPRQPGLLARSLGGFDRAFYGSLGVIGAPGRWLARPAGRLLVGLVGLACLGAALALTLTAGR